MAVVAVAVFILVAYVLWWNTIILEREAVIHLQVIELQHGRSTVVRISGLSGHSALSVKKITSHVENGEITVIVRLFLAREGTSGNFQYDVPVPESVNEIRFGQKKELIWRRESGPESETPGLGKSS
ncbi:MAG: hypothetical protein ACHP9V_07575 [Terriglobales bacterium]